MAQDFIMIFHRFHQEKKQKLVMFINAPNKSPSSMALQLFGFHGRPHDFAVTKADLPLEDCVFILGGSGALG